MVCGPPHLAHPVGGAASPAPSMAKKSILAINMHILRINMHIVNINRRILNIKMHILAIQHIISNICHITLPILTIPIPGPIPGSIYSWPYSLFPVGGAATLSKAVWVRKQLGPPSVKPFGSENNWDL